MSKNKIIENIFAYDGEIIDIQILESKGIDTLQSKIYFCGVLLNGGTESTLPHNECFFESLNLNENSSFNAINSNNNLNFKNLKSNVLNSSDLNSSNNSNARNLNKNPSANDSDSSTRVLNNNSNSNDLNLNSSKAYSNNDLDETKPIYYLEYDEFDLNSRDSSKSLNSNNSTQILQVFLNNHKLTILNYSILNSSLNIKLECKSKEANKIKENEINQQKELEFKKNKINLSSIAMLCPILECDELRCIHGGQVLLKSNLGKSIKAKLKDDSIKDAPIMLESDLLYSPILNCPNSIAGIANPCTQIALILPSARGLKKYNEDYPIMQDLCMSGVFSDKGFAVICTKQENTLKINAPKPSNNNIDSKEAKKPNIKLTQPRLRLHYKEYDKQKDNVLIARFYLNDILQEKTQDEYFSNIELDFDKDTKDIENMLLKDKIAIDYPSKSYDLRQIDIMLGIHHLCLIFAIPTKIPKIFKKPYESYEYKEYGVGKYKALFVYNVDFENIKDSSDASDSNESSDDIVITHIRVFLAPAKAKKLDFVFAVGLDSWLENENICSFKIMADDVWYDSNIHNDD